MVRLRSTAHFSNEQYIFAIGRIERIVLEGFVKFLSSPNILNCLADFTQYFSEKSRSNG